MKSYSHYHKRSSKSIPGVEYSLSAELAVAWKAMGSVLRVVYSSLVGIK